MIDWLVKWRINDPRQFIRNNGVDMRNLEARLSPIVQAAFNEEVTKHTVRDVLSSARDKVMQDVRSAADRRRQVVRHRDPRRAHQAGRLRRRHHRVDLQPHGARSASRSPTSCAPTGGAEGEKIRADADRQREVIVAEAYRDAQKIKGEGDAKASAIYADAFGRDPQFAAVLPQPRGLPGELPQQVRRDGRRPEQRLLQGDARARRRRAPPRRREEEVAPWLAVSFWDLALSAIALMLIVEGLLPFLSPGAWRRVFERALQMSDGQIRFLGLCSILAGLAMLLLVPGRCTRPGRAAVQSSVLTPRHSHVVCLATARAHRRCPAVRGPPHRGTAAQAARRWPRSYGFELVIPPMLEHLESLLSGTGHALDLQTFKLVDQLSGRTLGVRADTTPQVARIDAHLLNRRAWRACATAARCCTRGRPAARDARAAAVRRRDLRPRRARGRPRDPGPGARLPARRRRRATSSLDLADARIVRARARRRRRSTPIGSTPCTPRSPRRTRRAARAERAAFRRRRARGLRALVDLYGDAAVLDEARAPAAERAGDRARRSTTCASWRAHARAAHPRVAVGFDLADSSGYAYYSGARFAVYAARRQRRDRARRPLRRGRRGLRPQSSGRRLQPRRARSWRCARRRRCGARADPRAVERRRRRCAAQCARCARAARSWSRAARARPRDAANSPATASWSPSDGQWIVRA